MNPSVDSAFIRRTVDACDLAALRAALYQASGDPELASFGPVAGLAPQERGRLVEKAVHLLETGDLYEMSRVPRREDLAFS